MSADSGTTVSTSTTAAVPGTPDPALLDDLVTANRILSNHGVLDAYGHISARDPVHRQHYWISRSMPPAQVGAADIIACDLDNNPVRPGETRLFFERVIHGEIYKARPDVMAVLHNHCPSLIPFCNSDTRLRPMVGSAAFLGDGAPVFDIRTIDDEGDLNICTLAQGKGLARALGGHGLVLLRGHGAVAVGDSVRQVVRRAIIADSNAKQQMQATMLGAVHFLTASEIEYAKRMKPKDPDRAWRLWKQRAMGE
ncbi:MAG TPA: class II aldolase/adducin family protein [Xanthobacteraceae bacterium]|nr:class II aldolase/adducin family protein [Xanthobacteraceae bacterium]